MIRSMAKAKVTDLRKHYPELADCLLVAVTEKRTQEEIDTFYEALKA